MSDKTFDQVFDEINWDDWRYQPIREVVRHIHTLTSSAIAQEPVGYQFQHDETGRLVMVDAWQVANGFEMANPRLRKAGALYLHAAPQPVMQKPIALTFAGWQAKHGPNGAAYDIEMQQAGWDGAIKYAAPQPQGEQCSSADVEVSYEVIQDDMQVAVTSGQNAYKEILHYAAQYEQDGPIEIYKVHRILIKETT